ncbi:MAG: hypothetical protein AEth_00978 [Candidatus Argoarchaeum ethanivorans]|uniref:Helicase n=1 Tax=Candidatus Argoarchaeum ethanivorans TaxID=2608793 RepID=A0A8B3S2S0_9EURY|nr:MAG: hypothetical protein AEth_00978 [Candidatus Argoarchaeum ethanivorans]
MISISSQEMFVEDMVNYILSRMAGDHDQDEFVDGKPSRKFLIGTLAARKDTSTDLMKIKDNDTKASIRIHRLKASVLVKKTALQLNPEIKIKATGYVYYKVKKNSGSDQISKVSESGSISDEQDDIKSQWKRLAFDHNRNFTPSSNNTIEEHVDFSNIMTIANHDPLIRKKTADDVWNAKISVQTSDFDEHHILVSFNYENCGIEPLKDSDFERTIFNCKLSVDLGNLEVEEFCDEYLYEGHKQRYYYDFRTINCQAEWIDNKKQFMTGHWGKFLQENIRPRSSISGLNLLFSDLMSPDDFIPSLDKLVVEMKKYLEYYRNNVPASVSRDEFQPRTGNREKTWNERIEHIRQFECLILRIESGINLVKSRSRVKDVFLKTNETFNNYYISRGVSYAGWRVFQLVFFLASIESIVEEKDLDVVDVLHVDTGGGKSEAYFALVSFTAFYERVTGKKDGVSAIVKFPLRMLSIQQLERISGIIIHAEKVRGRSPTFPGFPFTLGYYVGNRDEEFPALYQEVRKRLYHKDGKLITPPPISLVLSKCPLCPPEEKGDIRLHDDPDHKRILHKCDRCKSEFYIYTSDREIFRWRPTVIVSTVDKWAALSQQRRIRSLLGGCGSLCPDGHGFIPSGDRCEEKTDEAFQCDNVRADERSSAGPRLSIQDEMHLLRECFGTISSHFEGLVEALVEDTSSGRKLKHIAMSATLNGSKDQIKELYHKDSFVIPEQCPEGVGSPNDFFFEKLDGPKRIVYGLKPNVRDNHYAALRTLLHFAEFIIGAQRDLNSNSSDFCSRYLIEEPIDAQCLIN